jgi:hypothetical protein
VEFLDYQKDLLRLLGQEKEKREELVGQEQRA